MKTKSKTEKKRIPVLRKFHNLQQLQEILFLNQWSKNLYSRLER